MIKRIIYTCDLSPRILCLHSSQEESSKHILVKDLYREPVTTHGRGSFKNKNPGHVCNRLRKDECCTALWVVDWGTRTSVTSMHCGLRLLKCVNTDSLVTTSNGPYKYISSRKTMENRSTACSILPANKDKLLQELRTRSWSALHI